MILYQLAVLHHVACVPCQVMPPKSSKKTSAKSAKAGAKAEAKVNAAKTRTVVQDT